MPVTLHQNLTPTHQFQRSKLARLRAQLLEPVPGAGSGGGSGFDVSKSGDARIALVGFPSVGKSTFLSKTTKTKSEVAAYSFTTLTAIPGVLEYGGAEIQILDLPGIIEGASEGKGRGRQVISAAKVHSNNRLSVTQILALRGTGRWNTTNRTTDLRSDSHGPGCHQKSRTARPPRSRA